jgi:4-amino-4-deoxy-L-arabinose transferase-like glycosyltransferase
VVKVPLGTLVLGAIGLAFSFTRRFRRFDELLVWLPAFLVFAVASTKTGYTMHFRYVLPALPFALVGLSKVAEVKSLRARGLVVVLAGSSVLSSALVLPHSLAYFNEAVGGPSNGDAYLIDSNLDWGQDLLRFKRWFDAHPEARPLHLACEPMVDYRLAGLPDLPRPPVDAAGLTPGYYALDVQSLRADRFGYFLRLPPVERIGYTIRVYRLNQDDIDRLEAEAAGRRPLE